MVFVSDLLHAVVPSLPSIFYHPPVVVLRSFNVLITHRLRLCYSHTATTRANNTSTIFSAYPTRPFLPVCAGYYEASYLYGSNKLDKDSFSFLLFCFIRKKNRCSRGVFCISSMSPGRGLDGAFFLSVFGLNYLSSSGCIRLHHVQILR